MNSTTKTLAILSLALFAVAGTASAVTIDLTGGLGSQATITFFGDGRQIDAAATGAASNIFQTANGLGHTDAAVDPGEGLVFRTIPTGSPFRLLAITFFNFAQSGPSDEFDLEIDGVDVISGAVDSSSAFFTFGGSTAMFDVAAAFTGGFVSNNLVTDIVLINNNTNPSTGDWIIQSIEIEAVPEPASLLLFGSGLLALGYGLRRKRC